MDGSVLNSVNIYRSNIEMKKKKTGIIYLGIEDPRTFSNRIKSQCTH